MIDPAPESQSLVAEIDQPLIAVPFEQDGRWYVHSFVVQAAAAEMTNSEESLQGALEAIGGWSDLDRDEMVEALDRIRHENEPTLPIEP